MIGGHGRNIFRAVRLHKEAEAELFPHYVEIIPLKPCDQPPLSDYAIKHHIEAWCDDNEMIVALSRKDLVFFAYECDALMFYLRFA